MKRILLIAITLALSFCGNSTPKSNQSVAEDWMGVEVLYFHGKQRCATCNAIERLTQEVIEQEFAKDVKAGNLCFRVIDISQAENKSLAKEYEVTWSSLYINNRNAEKTSRENLTKFAFTHALNTPEVFKQGISKHIRKQLQ